MRSHRSSGSNPDLGPLAVLRVSVCTDSDPGRGARAAGNETPDACLAPARARACLADLPQAISGSP